MFLYDQPFRPSNGLISGVSGVTVVIVGHRADEIEGVAAVNEFFPERVSVTVIGKSGLGDRVP